MTKVTKQTASMLTRDGIRLDADIYRPDDNQTYPVLLMRQPYGRAIASTVVYAHPIWYASQGYLVVIQDVRGRGTSQGEFDLFSHEIEDGFDTVNWASQLPGSTGKVGMYGFSYQGMTQLYAAVEKPRSLKVICPAMLAYDLYTDWAYENGAFCLQGNLGWAVQLATETARLKGDLPAFNTLYAASRNLPFYNPSEEFMESLRCYDPYYFDWLNYPDPGEYWQKLSPKYLIQDVDLPMLHIGGWFDPYLRGTLNLYREMASRSQYPQHLIVGPWAHLPWGRKVGGVDYGMQAISPVDELQLRWFDQFLKDQDQGILAEPPVKLFEMGSNQWRNFDSFPEHNQQSYYLTSNGLASIREDAGKLVTSPLESQIPDVLVHDPWRPVPALGGHATMTAGSFERSSLDCRSDVLTYTSEPLQEDLHLAGEVAAEIYGATDAASFDLCAVLSEVHPDGRVYNLTQGYVRVDSPQFPVRIVLQATCARIAQGNCVRLSLRGACFPAYPVNPGTGKLPQETNLIEAEVITVMVNHGKVRACRVGQWT